MWESKWMSTRVGADVDLNLLGGDSVPNPNAFAPVKVDLQKPTV